MAAYRRVYDSRHLQADCQEPGSSPEPYARYSSIWATFTFYIFVGISGFSASLLRYTSLTMHEIGSTHGESLVACRASDVIDLVPAACVPGNLLHFCRSVGKWRSEQSENRRSVARSL